MTDAEADAWFAKHGHQAVTYHAIVELLGHATGDVLREVDEIRKGIEHELNTLKALTLGIEQLKTQEYAIQSLRTRLAELEGADIKKRLFELEESVRGVTA